MVSLSTIQSFAKNNSTSILTGCAMAGVVSTTIFAGKASIKAEKVLAEMDNDEEEISKKEKVKAIAPIFIPTIVSGILTMVCIYTSHSIESRKQIALLSACSLSEQAMKKMEDKLGEKKLKQVRESIFKDDVKNNPPREETIKDTGKGKTKFRDGIFGGDFYSDIEYVKSVFNKYNKMLNDGDIVYANDLRWDLGLEQTEMGSILGWDCGQLDEMLTSVVIDRDLQDVKNEDVENIFVLSYNKPTILHHGY